MNRAPAPSPMARAICQSLTGAPPRGFTLFEIMLAMGGLALISGASFIVYQGVANNADVRTEQANVQTIASNADKVYGALGSYQGLTTADAIQDKVPPSSMVAGAGLVSRWSQPVLVEPTDVDGKPNAGLRITYQAVPARACLKFAQAASEGMYDTQVAGHSVMSHGRVDLAAATTRCADGAPVVFTYYGGASGALAMVNPPVSLPPLNPPPATPPVAPPSAPPPVAPPPPPPAPGCGAAPSAPATGTTPPGQSCSFMWTSAPTPTCWVSQPLCTSSTPPPTAPPPTSPPATPPPSIPPPPPGVLCSVPPPTTETGNQSGTCTAGTLTPAGSSTFPQTRSRTITYSCPDPFDAPKATPGTWSPWSPTAASACAPICVAPPPLAETRAGTPDSRTITESQTVNQSASGTPETRTLYCPAGQYGQLDQSRATTITRTATQTRTQPQTRTTTQHRTTTYACNQPTGPATATVGAWGAPTTPYGTWTDSAPASAWSAPAPPYGTWSAPSPTGTWTTNSGSCTACPAPANQGEIRWVASSAACPAGQSGTHTWERQQQRIRTNSYACPAGTISLPPITYGPWGAYADTGAVRNVVNTCAPTAPPTACADGSDPSFYTPGYIGSNRAYDPAALCTMFDVGTGRPFCGYGAFPQQVSGATASVWNAAKTAAAGSFPASAYWDGTTMITGAGIDNMNGVGTCTMATIGSLQALYGWSIPKSMGRWGGVYKCGCK